MRPKNNLGYKTRTIYNKKVVWIKVLWYTPLDSRYPNKYILFFLRMHATLIKSHDVKSNYSLIGYVFYIGIFIRQNNTSQYFNNYKLD